MKKSTLLKTPVKHVDVTTFDSGPIIDAMRNMSFSSRDTAAATDILMRMLKDPKCTIILTLAGSTSAAGCMNLYADMIRYNMIDVVVATGAAIVDMDFFEAIGFKHYRGRTDISDNALRDMCIDRIYDTFIDECQLQSCDSTITTIADSLEPRVYSSREFIQEMGRYLDSHAVKKDSLVQLAYQHGVPIFCPAFSDSSAGFGLVKHQVTHPDRHVSIDSVKDFLELTQIKIVSGDTGVFMIGGGVPKNFTQDTVVCAEILEQPAPMHKYAVQVSVADVRDGACSSSTLKEAASWGKVDTTYEQMVYAEATTVLPLMISYLYHHGPWKQRKRQNLSKMFDHRPAVKTKPRRKAR